MKKDKKKKKTKEKIKREEVEVREDFDFNDTGELDNGRHLTIVEKLKLVRNCIVLLIIVVGIFILLVDSLLASEEIDLLVIFSSIVFTLIGFLLFVFFVKHILDLKNGSVEIFKGTIDKQSEEALYTSQLPVCTITLDHSIHHVGINHYLKIKDNDFVILRRAPITRCIVGLEINPE